MKFDAKGKIIVSALLIAMLGILCTVFAAYQTTPIDPIGYSSNVQKVMEVGDYTLKIDYAGTANPVYIGKAKPGSLITDYVWQIKYINYSGNNPTEILYANGTSDYKYVWANRTTVNMTVYS